MLEQADDLLLHVVQQYSKGMHISLLPMLAHQFCRRIPYVVSTPKVYTHKYTDLESILRYHLSTDVLCHVTVDLLGVPADGAQEVGGRHRSQKWHRRPTGT